MFQSRIQLVQFTIPSNKWTKLQEDQYIQNQQLGLPDIRVDCCINTFAFVGAIKRQDAEQIAKTVNDRGTGIMPDEAAGYLESKSGYEKSPHCINVMRTIREVRSAYSSVKENCASVIGISRADGSGHAASVVCVDGKLIVFDPQIETVFPDIEAWLIKEKAVAVESIFKLNKRVHCRDESNVSVSSRKVEDHIHKCYRMEDHVPEWKIKNFERTRQRKRDALKREFVADMLSVGFRLD